MSDEPKTDEMPSGEWVMPEPVFRTTTGQTPKSMHETEVQDEVPTVDPGFREADTLETEGLPPGENSVEPGFRDAPTIETKGLLSDIEPLKEKATTADKTVAKEPVKVQAAAPKSKKRGCFSSFLSFVVFIAVVVIAIIVALYYFFVYSRPTDNVTF